MHGWIWSSGENQYGKPHSGREGGGGGNLLKLSHVNTVSNLREEKERQLTDQEKGPYK